MKEINISFRNPDEIVKFVNTVSKYDYDMDMKRGRIVVDAKSLLGLLNLGLNKIIKLQVYSEDCEALQRDLVPFLAAMA